MRYPGLRIVLLSAPSHPRRGSGYLQISSPFTVAGQPRNHPLSGSPRSLTDPTWDYRPLCFLLTFLRQGCQEIFKAGAVLASQPRLAAVGLRVPCTMATVLYR